PVLAKQAYDAFEALEAKRAEMKAREAG
ncbi:MAG: hypothetical protein RL385_2642, partial [Pseudomonadota bacterium]